MARENGTVKWFNRQKGYGFIEREGEEEELEDVFIHHTEVPEGTVLEEGDEVSFEVEETEKGLQAQELELE